MSSSQLQVLGLTTQPHSSSIPAQIPAQIPACAASLGGKPWDAAVGQLSPTTQEGAGTPHLPLKHCKQNNPTALGLGCPLRHCPPLTCPALQDAAAAFPSPARLKAWPTGSDFMQQMHL